MKFQVILSINAAAGQLPPRLNIPGAVLVPQSRPAPQLIPQSRPAPFRNNQRLAEAPPPRLRRPPIPNAAPVPIRPVVEEPEESSSPSNNNFEDEVTKLGISALQTAVRQAITPEEETTRPVHFRPERPVPVLRQDIRENLPSPRQEQRENIPRPLLRQEVRDEDAPVRQQPIRHQQQVRSTNDI